MRSTIGSLALAAVLVMGWPGAARAQGGVTPPDSIQMYVVDGRIISPEEFRSIATKDIESVDVLSGTNAVKVYGEAGRRGVMVITRKKALPPPTPSHLQAIEELLQVMRLESMMTNNPMLATLREQSPDGSGMVDVLEEFMNKYLKWADMKPEFVALYAATFSEPDVRELVTFYKSPVGTRLVAATPELSTKAMEIVQSRMMAHMEELMEIMQRQRQTP